MVGVKQDKVLSIGREKGRVTVNNIRSLYPQRVYAIACLESLAAQGYFEKKLDDSGTYYWEYVGEE